MLITDVCMLTFIAGIIGLRIVTVGKRVTLNINPYPANVENMVSS